MAIQFGTALRNARADATETTIGVSAILEWRSGPKPANCAAADSGTLLASATLPVDYLTDAASGVKSLVGTWEDTAANAQGTIGHFRLKNNAGSVCHVQGSVTITGGGGDMTVDNPSLEVGQVIAAATFILTEGNA